MYNGVDLPIQQVYFDDPIHGSGREGVFGVCGVHRTHHFSKKLLSVFLDHHSSSLARYSCTRIHNIVSNMTSK